MQQDGTRKKLKVLESIHRATGVELSGPCRVSAFTFFYGSKDEILENDMLQELRRRHPECQRAWPP